MTPEQLNIAIAQSDGFVLCDLWVPFDSHGTWTKRCDHKKCVPVQAIPNFCGDLNLMHEVELKLEYSDVNSDFNKYCTKLNEIACRLKCGNLQSCGYTISATALQRAEAYAKVKGIWNEL